MRSATASSTQTHHLRGSFSEPSSDVPAPSEPPSHGRRVARLRAQAVQAGLAVVGRRQRERHAQHRARDRPHVRFHPEPGQRAARPYQRRAGPGVAHERAHLQKLLIRQSLYPCTSLLFFSGPRAAILRMNRKI